jgi:VWFA-related protein
MCDAAPAPLEPLLRAAELERGPPPGEEQVMNRVLGVSAAILLAASVFPTLARQTPQPVPRFRTSVNLVLLDVSVLDDKRVPIRGLTADDFTILEDGRPQSIQTFSAIDLPDVVTAADAPAAWVRDVAPDVRSNRESDDQRVIVIVLDDHTPLEAQWEPWVKRMGRTVVDRLGPSDLASVVYTWEKSKGQEFTQDRTRLRAAIDRFMGKIPGGLGEPGMGAFSRALTPAYAGTLGTLLQLCQWLGDLPQRRKTLVFISPGLPIDFDAAQPRAISLNEPAAATESGMVQGTIGQMQDLLDAARRANVNIYGIDPAGLQATRSVTNALSGQTTWDPNPNRLGREFLQSLSENTGGFAVVDTNDYQSAVTQVFRENGSYYLLGYVASNRREQGRFRKVEVRVNRPGATVRARNGYHEPAPPQSAEKTAPKPAAPPIDLALAALVPKSDVRMQVTAAPFAAPGRRQAAVALVIGTQQRSPARATRLTQAVDLRIVAHSPDGRQRASRHVTVPITLNMPSPGGTMGYELLARLELPPGRYYIRVAAETSLHGVQLSPRAPAVGFVAPGEDTSNRSGSVYCDLDVPDFVNDELSLSGAVLSVTPPVVSGPKDALASILPVVPTTLREFAPEDQVTAFLRVYQGGTKTLVPVTVEARIVDASNAKMFETTETIGAERFARDRAADYFVQLPISRLNGGRYLFTISAASGQRTIRRDVRFDVR